MYSSPTLFGVVYTSRLFDEVESGDSLQEFRHHTAPKIDLRRQQHATRYLEWLNKWGCRITKKSFPNITIELSKWFGKWGGRLPITDLSTLAPKDLDALTDAYKDLLEISEFGPTSAAKSLFALRPQTAIPWDAKIQDHFGLAGLEKTQYRAMLELSKKEANELLENARLYGINGAQDLLKFVGHRADSLPRLLDQYHWVTITREHKIPSKAELKKWVQLINPNLPAND